MKKLVLLILLLPIMYFTSDAIEIKELWRGLNTMTAKTMLLPGEAVIAHNVVLNEETGAITTRDGYDSVFTIPGLDSILNNGLFSFSYSDAQKGLLIVGDSTGVGYANIYSTAFNTLSFGQMDSFYIAADTADVDDYAQSTGSWLNLGDGFEWELWITARDTEYVFDITLDSAESMDKNTVVDTFVAEINASGVSNYVTASNNNDTLIIVSDSVDLLIQISTYAFKNDDPTEWFDPTYGGYLVPNNKIATKFPATGVPKIVQHRENIYITSPTGRSVVYDGNSVTSYPINSPGEITALPLTTAGSLKGHYRYAVKYASVEDSVSDTLKTNDIGFITNPIIVDNQQVLLYNFPPPVKDYYFDQSDTITFEIWRTTGDIGAIDESDTIWFTGITVQLDSSNYATYTVTDTISDDSLRNSAEYQLIVNEDKKKWQSGFISSPDTLPNTIVHKPGSPSILSWGGCADTNDYGQGGLWLYNDGTNDTSVTWKMCAGFSYVCVWYDTTKGLFSDTSRSFNFFHGDFIDYISDYGELKPVQFVEDYTDSTFVIYYTPDSEFAYINLGFSKANTEKITLRLPEDNGINSLCLLYRAPIIPMKYDSLYGANRSSSRESIQIRYKGEDFYTPYYYLIGEYSPGDVVYDSLRYDSLLNRDIYEPTITPRSIKDIISYDNRLFITDGDYIYYSNITDTATVFTALNIQGMNFYDGDQITTLWAQKGGIKFAKNKSTYNYYKNSNGGYSVFDLSNHYGCISRQSHVSAPEGEYFLSMDGVRLEEEGIYKENSFIGSLKSGRIKNITDKTFSDLRKSFAVYYDNKYYLTVIPAGTTYVLNKTLINNEQYYYGWTTSSLLFSGAALYRESADNEIIPGDSLYFIKPGGSTVYRLGGTSDNGTYIPWAWKSGGLNKIDGTLYQIKDIGFQVSSEDTVDNSTYCVFFDDKGNIDTDENILFSRLDTTYYHYFYQIASRDALFWQIALGSIGAFGVVQEASGRSKFYEIDINFEEKGKISSQ